MASSEELEQLALKELSEETDMLDIGMWKGVGLAILALAAAVRESKGSTKPSEES